MMSEFKTINNRTLDETMINEQRRSFSVKTYRGQMRKEDKIVNEKIMEDGRRTRGPERNMIKMKIYFGSEDT